MKQQKTLKVYTQPNGKPTNYPEIRLSGKWLLKLGFAVGDYIRILYDAEVIVIRRIECENNSE